mmetsp:Transcript_11138/g.23663  ORF Transcript_11138/g.23663 Transcript_11138/m.23663 type:complete len:200 (-) Transcript_11138:18-617(-)
MDKSERLSLRWRSMLVRWLDAKCSSSTHSLYESNSSSSGVASSMRLITPLSPPQKCTEKLRRLGRTSSRRQSSGTFCMLSLRRLGVVAGVREMAWNVTLCSWSSHSEGSGRVSDALHELSWKWLPESMRRISTVSGRASMSSWRDGPALRQVMAGLTLLSSEGGSGSVVCAPSKHHRGPLYSSGGTTPSAPASRKVVTL